VNVIIVTSTFLFCISTWEVNDTEIKLAIKSISYKSTKSLNNFKFIEYTICLLHIMRNRLFVSLKTSLSSLKQVVRDDGQTNRIHSLYKSMKFSLYNNELVFEYHSWGSLFTLL
jgi:hypothetical protein